MTVFIIILAIGSVSGVVTAQFVMGLDGDTLKNLLGGCIYGACKDTKIIGNTNPNLTGSDVVGCAFAGCKGVDISGGGQPTPNTAKLIVTKDLQCASGANCADPSDFTISVTATNASPKTFQGSATGTIVTLDPGTYQVTEVEPIPAGFTPTYTQNCNGSIQAGEIRACTITNSNK